MDSRRPLNWKRIGEHVAFWIAYILFKVIINLTDSEGKTTEELFNAAAFLLSSQLPYFVVHIPAVYALFYIIDLYFDNRMKLPAAIAWSAVIMFVAVVVIDVVNHKFILPVVYNDYDHPLKFDPGSLIYYSFLLISVVGVACTAKLVRAQVRSKARHQALQQAKVEAELQFLKAQVSPHFLFNTLNNIYALARKQSTHTADAVMKLSKLLGFILYGSSNENILLREELRLIADYVELEKLRYTDRLKVNYVTDIDDEAQRIAPLLLIHFVENAFKHGVSETHFDATIDILITLKDAVLTAHFANSVNEKHMDGDAAQIGLSNTRRQLELLYPSHQLTIARKGDLFTVDLKINLTPKA